MVNPAAKRAQVSDVCAAYEISARRACGLFALWESSLYYKRKGRNDEALRSALN